MGKTIDTSELLYRMGKYAEIDAGEEKHDAFMVINQNFKNLQLNLDALIVIVIFMPTTHLIQSTKTIIPQLLISSCDTLALNVARLLNKSILRIIMKYSVNQHFLNG